MCVHVPIVPLRNTTHHVCTVELQGTTKTTAAMAPTSSVMIVEVGDSWPNIVGITNLLAMMIVPQIQASWNILLVVYT